MFFQEVLTWEISIVNVTLQSFCMLRLYGDKTQKRGKVLIFSPFPSHENGRGNVRNYVRRRGRGSRASASEDHEDESNYSRKTKFRGKSYDKKSNFLSSKK